MVIPELEQQLLQLSPNDKLYIIQLLAQSLSTQNNDTLKAQPRQPKEFFYQFSEVSLPEKSDLTQLLKTLIESLQAETSTEIPKYPLPQFYGCIKDETFFRHPQREQPEREVIQ